METFRYKNLIFLALTCLVLAKVYASNNKQSSELSEENDQTSYNFFSGPSIGRFVSESFRFLSSNPVRRRHPPGRGGHPPGVGKHPPGIGKHPPGVGKHPPGIGKHKPRPRPWFNNFLFQPPAPTQLDNGCCIGKADGYFADLKTGTPCSRFCECVNGSQVYLLSCPYGLLFNEEANECDVPSRDVCPQAFPPAPPPPPEANEGNLKGGLVPPENAEDIQYDTRNDFFRYQSIAKRSLPSSVDWRKAGVLPPVKFQAACDSCWAFVVTGAVESINAIVNKNSTISLSEQQLIDCSSSGNGCLGGWPDTAMDYVVKNGLASEKEYPYKADSQSCEESKVQTPSVKISAFETVPALDTESLMKAVANQPVIVKISAASVPSFRAYKGGIYYGTDSTGSYDCDSIVDHAVLVVGYGYEIVSDSAPVNNASPPPPTSPPSSSPSSTPPPSPPATSSPPSPSSGNTPTVPPPSDNLSPETLPPQFAPPPLSPPEDSSPIETSPPPTEIAPPPTETSLPPTETFLPPTEIAPPPTETSLPPTETSLPPTETSLPPTEIAPPPTESSLPPIETSLPPTETAPPPIETVLPTDASLPPPPVDPASVAIPPDESPLPPSSPPSSPAASLSGSRRLLQVAFPDDPFIGIPTISSIPDENSPAPVIDSLPPITSPPTTHTVAPSSSPPLPLPPSTSPSTPPTPPSTLPSPAPAPAQSLTPVSSQPNSIPPPAPPPSPELQPSTPSSSPPEFLPSELLPSGSPLTPVPSPSSNPPPYSPSELPTELFPSPIQFPPFSPSELPFELPAFSPSELPSESPSSPSESPSSSPFAEPPFQFPTPESDSPFPDYALIPSPSTEPEISFPPFEPEMEPSVPPPEFSPSSSVDSTPPEMLPSEFPPYVLPPPPPPSPPPPPVPVGYKVVSYWIIRNSWGPNWGEGGYMRIAMSSGVGVCNMISLPGIYPVTSSGCEGPNPCGGGTCILGKGNNYMCVCPPGYTNVKNSDGTQTCAVGDACTSSTFSPCGFGTCIPNGKGSYTCTCPPGFVQGENVAGTLTCILPSTEGDSSKFTYTTTPSDTCASVSKMFSLSILSLCQINPPLCSSGQCYLPESPYNVTVGPIVQNSGCGLWYVLDKGENCQRITRNFNLTESKLKSLNGDGFDCANLKPGHSVCIQEGSAAIAPQCQSYRTVKERDSCGSIVYNTGLSFNVFYALNPGILCSNLNPGDEVCVYPAQGNLGAGSSLQVVGGGKCKRYRRVRKGDSCLSIAYRCTHGSLPLLWKLNGGVQCRDNKLIPGYRLCVCWWGKQCPS